MSEFVRYRFFTGVVRMAIECKKCGVKLADNAVFCHWCKAPVPREIEQDPTKRLRWLKFWNYGLLPFFCVLCGFVVVFGQASMVWTLLACALSALSALGLHQRKRWGWNLNWVMVVMIGLSLAGLMAFDETGTIDGLVSKLFLTVPMTGLLWFWPNYVYWRKRSVLFV